MSQTLSSPQSSTSASSPGQPSPIDAENNSRQSGNRQSKCNCDYDILQLNQLNRPSVKAVKRAHDRVKNLVESSEDESVVVMREEVLTCVGIAFTRLTSAMIGTEIPETLAACKCSLFQQVATLIRNIFKVARESPRPASATDGRLAGIPMDLNMARRIRRPPEVNVLDKILRHWYKDGKLMFVCSWKGYFLTSCEIASELSEYLPEIRSYMSTLTQRSIRAMVQSEPSLLRAIKRY